MRKNRQSRLFYGWVLVAVSAVSMAVVYSIRHSFSRFFLVMVDDFGWSRAAASGIYSVNVIGYGLMAPVAGAVADRLGPRKVIPIGAAALGLGAVLASQGNGLWQFYLLWLVLALGACFTGYVPHVVSLTNWFQQKRGAAMGLFQVGGAVAFFAPFLTQLMITGWSWRVAYAVWGLAVLAIVAPLALVFQRRRPQDMGLQPDGLPTTAVQRDQAEPDPAIVDRRWAAVEWTLARAARTRRFWAFFFGSFFMWGIGQTIVLVHQIALMVDAGYSDVFATLVFALFGAMTLVGTLCGFLSDRIGREATVTIAITLMLTGVGMLFLVRDANQPWLLYLFAMGFGLGTGLNNATYGSAVADVFQGKNFGVINGCMTASFGLGGALGAFLAGLIFDVWGSYNVALLSVEASLLVAIALVWVAAPRKVRLVAGRARRAAATPSPAASGTRAR